MKSKVLLSLFFCLGVLQWAHADSFNEGWTFRYEGHGKEEVTLPHDAMIHMPRNAQVPGGGSVGYYEGALFIYEKTFDVPKEWLSKNVSFRFGGVYKEAKVFINDNYAGGIPYGYMPFTVSADGFLKEGANTIRVEADNTGQRSSRWYSGGGIYRPVEIMVQDPVHVISSHVTTTSISPARVLVETLTTEGTPFIEILDKGRVIASGEGSSVELEIPGANLWSADSPYLYTVKATLKDASGRTCDTFEDKFGIRILSWNADGFYVNGKKEFLRGGCIHADNGILGSAEYREASDRKVSILKQYGFNAIRSAHNPCSDEMLRSCDSLGMYIMDELWDMWFKSKNPNDYGKYFMDKYRNDLVALVEKDFNHPSVVLYSIGNEISEPTAPGGLEITKDIVSRLHEMDPTRPVTGGMNTIILGSGAGGGMMMGGGPSQGGSDENLSKDNGDRKSKKKARKNRKPSRIYVEPEIPEGGLVSFGDMMKGGLSSDEYNEMVQQHILTDDYMIMGSRLDSIITPVLDELDIVGYNYATVRYPTEGNRHPGRLVFGSETYPQDIWRNWEMVKEYPYVFGDFMWTAWDYIGECGIGSWSYGERQRGYPAKLSDCGAIDLVGNPTGEAFLAKATWEEKSGVPYIAVRPVNTEKPRQSQWRGTNSIPSWTWKGKEGVMATVEVFTSARKVKLFLNGKKVGKARTENGVAIFEIPYEPGELTARTGGLFSGRKENTLRTAEGPDRIMLSPETIEVREGQLVYIPVSVVDANGTVDSSSDAVLNISVEGGRLAGFGSGLPVTEARFDSGSYPAYYGQALAAVIADGSASLTVSVSSEGLPSSSVTIPLKK